MCPTALSWSWTTGIKNGLAALGTQLGSCVSKARSRVTEVLARHADRRCYHNLQDMWTCHYSMAQQCSVARLTTQNVVGRGCDPARRYCAANQSQRGTSDRTGRTTRRSSHHLPNTSYRVIAALMGHQPPRGHLSGSGCACNCSALCYKGIGQPPILKKVLSGRFNSALNSATHTWQYNISLCSSCSSV
jgi:hypothetical protein